MLKRLIQSVLVLCLFEGIMIPVLALPFQQLDFSLHKLGQDEAQPTLLIVGGIQGDEPGGFNAASLLVTDYHIQHGNVWVVPNLNFKSIIQRSRGIYGDMNRKFLRLTSHDPDYAAIEKIKTIILDPRVTMVLNLHDGSGFYNPVYKDSNHNPHRWGQSIIIDQANLGGEGEYTGLEKMAQYFAAQANQRLDNEEHFFHVRNTYTSNGDQEMEKTLTYFAARHLKPAFGVEASKSFLTHERVFFHLQVIEAAMRFLGIKYQREFNLTRHDLKDRINNNVQVSIFGNKIFFDMHNARRRIGYVPLKKNTPLRANSNNPLVAVIDEPHNYRVQYGNRNVTRLSPEYFEYDDSIKGIDMMIDGKSRFVPFGSQIKVQDHFRVKRMSDYRVNVIGYRSKKGRDEDGELIGYQDIHKRYSIDTTARRFRVEVYTAHRYCGMVIVDFHDKPVASKIRKNSDSNT